MEEWDWEENAGLDPTNLNKGWMQRAAWKCRNGHQWIEIINHRIEWQTSCSACRRRLPEREDSLLKQRPELVLQWDWKKNLPLRPEQFTCCSKENVWWRCEAGHSWCARISSRVNGKAECPYCNSSKLLVGVNDLQTVAPQLAAEWDQAANGTLFPEDVMASSNRKVWWRCAHGHCWGARVCNRTEHGESCPYCAANQDKGELPQPEDTLKILVTQWDEEKNTPLRFETVNLEACKKKLWWRCEKGHSWQATFFDRQNRQCGCPYCSGKSVLPGFNDLASQYPELAVQWAQEENAPLRPEEVNVGSHVKVWWRCEKQHLWHASVHDRMVGRECPYCAGRKVLAGFNDLQTLNPAVAAEWDAEKNAPLTPQQVTVRGSQNVYWICEKGHSYQAVIGTRTGKRNTGCPYCAGKRVLAGFNDLQTQYPELAREWNEERNAPATPDRVLPTSKEKFWWNCPNGHIWEGSVSARMQDAQCPYCSGADMAGKKLPFPLAYPNLYAQWDTERNVEISPWRVQEQSLSRVGWICDVCGTRWEATIFSRTNGKSNCPECEQKKRWHRRHSEG